MKSLADLVSERDDGSVIGSGISSVVGSGIKYWKVIKFLFNELENII